MSFNPQSFLSLLPQIALAGLALIIIIALWMIWRSIAPAAPGTALGYYEIMGRYAGSKLIRRLKGTIVDCTPIFLSPKIEKDFKEILKEDLDRLIARSSNKDDKAGLMELRKKLENEKNLLSDYCRILAVRDVFRKHIIIQYGRVDKPLNNYAVHEPSSKFTLSMGFLSHGIITGVIETLPQRWEIYRIGKAYVHLFCPDDPENPNSPIAMPKEWLAKLALYAPATVELENLIKSKDDQILELKRKNMEIGQELSAMATELDSMRMAVQGFSVTGKLPERMTPKKLDASDILTILFPTVVGYYLLDYLQAQPIIGVLLGLMIGIFILYRRKGGA